MHDGSGWLVIGGRARGGRPVRLVASRGDCAMEAADTDAEPVVLDEVQTSQILDVLVSAGAKT